MNETPELVDLTSSPEPQGKPNSVIMKPPSEPPRKIPKIQESTGFGEKLQTSTRMHAVSIKSSTPVTEQNDISSLLASEMVTFYVGPKRNAYHVHRDLICSSSSVLRQHFGTLDTKTPVVTMYLPDHSPGVFELLVSFLYRGSFAEMVPQVQKEASQVPYVQMDDHNASKVNQLLNLHFLAHDWNLPNLLNLSLDHIRRYVMTTKQIFRAAQIATVYKRLESSEEPLRRFVVDQFVYFVMRRKNVEADVRRSYLRNRMGIQNSAFLFEVIEAMIGMKGYPKPVDPNAGKKCLYHKHAEVAECPD
ncbi:MAG: hypothetical protein Q9171_005047 [Xanthocarpia ochracea]